MKADSVGELMIISVGAVCNHCGHDIVSVVVVLRYHDMHINSVGNRPFSYKKEGMTLNI